MWERKKRERREEKTEKEEADKLEKFRKEKLSILQEEEGPRAGQKRKRGVACMEEDMPRIIEPEHHERSLEQTKDARSFSKKSHIVKHWMSCHPEESKPDHSSSRSPSSSRTVCPVRWLRPPN